jgi:hypothetical protein
MMRPSRRSLLRLRVAAAQRRRRIDLDGGLDTERARAYLATLPVEARPKAKRESPQFTGRVIAALYASDVMMDYSGKALIGAELGAVHWTLTV